MWVITFYKNIKIIIIQQKHARNNIGTVFFKFQFEFVGAKFENFE